MSAKEQFDYYIYPKRARMKMKIAEQNRSAVYIFGMSGYGKTTFLKRYLSGKKYTYISLEENLPDRIDEEELRSNPILVIDDLHLAEDTAITEKIIQMIRENKLWLILCARCRCPGWLLEVSIKQRAIMIIEEADFMLEEKNVETFFIDEGIPYTKDKLSEIVAYTKGNGMAIKIIADFLKEGSTFDQALIGRVRRILWDYLEHNICNHWDVKLLEFLVQVSIVDSFTIEFADRIIDRGNAYEMIAKAQSVGNFLTEENGVYTLENYVLLGCLRRKLLCEYSQEYRNDLYYNAGRYYEQKGMAIEALRMYEKCGNQNRISAILVDNARQNPNSGYLYELRDYYLSLPENKIKESTELMAGMSILCSMMMNKSESEVWYEALKEREAALKGSGKRNAASWLAYLDFALPHRGSDHIVEQMEKAAFLIMNRRINLPELSITSSLPSQMNGGKDFCEWSKKDRELAAGLGKLLPVLFGKYAKGMIENALAESLFEKGEDEHEILRLVSAGILRAEMGGKLEQSFVGNAILSRLRLFDGDIDDVVELMESFKKRVGETGDNKAGRLLANIDAFLCRLYLYRSDELQIEEWMSRAPKEEIEFFSMERYRYLTKIRVYLFEEKYEKALYLIDKLELYAKEAKRTYIQMELCLLRAIVLFRCKKQEWEEEFEMAYSRIEEYQFVRLISREGAAVLPLLNKAKLPIKKKKFYNRLLEDTQSMAGFYSSYLKQKDKKYEFSDNAIRILRCQARGMTNSEIAQQLGVNIGTVKYHCKENYKKLGVKGKAAAIAEARQRKLI